MSIRTVDRPADTGRWHSGQAAELINGTVGIVVCFALVCLFLIVMAH